MLEVLVGWRGGAVLWAVTNVLVAQSASPDDLLSWGLTLAGVTIPFGVGWAWNRQWAEAVKRQNQFLREQDELLRDELTDERAEKLMAYEAADLLRQQLTEVQLELAMARSERDQLLDRLAHLEEVVRLRKSDKPPPPSGGDRRKRDLIRSPREST